MCDSCKQFITMITLEGAMPARCRLQISITAAIYLSRASSSPFFACFFINRFLNCFCSLNLIKDITLVMLASPTAPYSKIITKRSKCAPPEVSLQFLRNELITKKYQNSKSQIKMCAATGLSKVFTKWIALARFLCILGVQQLQMMHNTGNIIITIDCRGLSKVFAKLSLSKRQMKKNVLCQRSL